MSSIVSGERIFSSTVSASIDGRVAQFRLPVYKYRFGVSGIKKPDNAWITRREGWETGQGGEEVSVSGKKRATNYPISWLW